MGQHGTLCLDLDEADREKDLYRCGAEQLGPDPGSNPKCGQDPSLLLGPHDVGMSFQRPPGEGKLPAEKSAGAHAPSILLFEDDETLADLLARVLRTQGYRVDVLDSALDVPEGPRLAKYDLVLSDVHLAGDTNGLDVLRRIHETSPTTPVILMTAYADIEGAMNAVGQGAYDYLAKPIEPNDLKRMVSEAIARRTLAQSDSEALPNRGQSSDAQIIGTTGAMLAVYKTVAHVAPTTATILIIGESGTGKELVARAIHTKSARASGRFVAVNCGALPESILESELFGHERGSFTGASATKRGLFEEAKGGTLLLDEIGEISPKMQVQLLRVLQEGEVRRVGASETIKVDARVVAATNRDLKAEVAAGRFREDLLFRLQVVTVHVPPLRDRKADIPLLIRHFIARHAERLCRPPPRVAREVFQILESYPFPGNVRELSHIIERAMLLAREGVITPSDLASDVASASSSSGEGAQASGSLAGDWPTLAVLDRRYIDRVLSRTGGNKTRAAEVLGIDRRTLNRMFARERSSQGDPLSDDELDALEREEEDACLPAAEPGAPAGPDDPRRFFPGAEPPVETGPAPADHSSPRTKA